MAALLPLTNAVPVSASDLLIFVSLAVDLVWCEADEALACLFSASDLIGAAV